MADRKTKCLIGVDAGTYTFNAATKTITFSAGLISDLEQVLLITNVVSNIVIYKFNAPGFGGTLAADVLTLDYDTSAMNNADELQIWAIAEATLPLKVTFDGTAQPVSISGAVTVNLPAGAATEAKQDVGNTSLASIDAKLTNPLPVSATSLPLPTGASTEAKQDSEINLITETNTSLDELLTAINNLTATLRVTMQAILNPPYFVKTGDIKVIPGSGTAGTMPVTGTIAVSTFGAGATDMTFMMKQLNEIMISEWKKEIISR